MPLGCAQESGCAAYAGAVTDDDSELADLHAITAAAVTEVPLTDPEAALSSAGWPRGADLIAHLGSHFGWVLRTIGADERPERPEPPATGSLPDWFAAEGDRFLHVLSTTPASAPAWTFRGPATLAFWRRRSMFEIARHVWDLRTRDATRPPPPPELPPSRYADGVSEHFDVFLPSARVRLPILPGALRLVSSDTGHTWTLTPDWQRPDAGAVDATIEATAGMLALLCWERADALAQPAMEVTGDVNVVRAFQAAPIQR